MRWAAARERLEDADRRLRDAKLEHGAIHNDLFRRVELPKHSGVVWIFPEQDARNEYEFVIEVEDGPHCDADGNMIHAAATGIAIEYLYSVVALYERGKLFDLPTSAELTYHAERVWRDIDGDTVPFPLVDATARTAFGQGAGYVPVTP